jgi:hypothetical protein
MRVALLTTFKTSKKEPLAEVLERIHAAFLASGQGEPSVRFSLSDAPLPGFVSSVDRVLKRYPQLERFVVSASPYPGGLPIRQIAGEALEFPTLLAIAAGVPRSFPFHNFTVQFYGPAFGEGDDRRPGSPGRGVTVTDSWWVNGRQRFLAAMTIVDADPASKKLPSPPEAVAAVLAACGKIKSTVQVPFEVAGSASGNAPTAAAPDPEAARAVKEVVLDYRARFEEILERAALPHDLPPFQEALKSTALGQTTGPKKPVLVRAFKPLGYDCQGGSGTFTLRRRTAGNLTVEISMDVGTWSRSITAHFKVKGPGFRALLPLPVSRRAGSGQYPIGDGEQWGKIVDNMAALVKELERTFIPAVEAASGPAPEWYRPES